MDHATWQQRTYGPTAPCEQEMARHGARPDASWVMGRSGRWHDPDVAAEIRMSELAETYRDGTVIGAGAGLGSPVALLIGIWRGVRALRRPPRA